MNKPERLVLLAVVLTVLVAVPVAADPAQPAGAAAQALERFKALAGQWEGTSSHGKVNVSYEVVAHGTAVLERLEMHGEEGHQDMITLYHLDGDSLMLTHYCAVGNQPRMRAADPARDQVRFDLIDITALPSLDAGHMHRARFTFENADKLTSAWTWRENGADAFTVELKLQRVAPHAARR